ncbi:uncharacterized protein LOC142332962 isoform X1 [Lycorma delicatula]|uniref:uncharacterized protein LOC142332962 isoform X1 n=1 Tax=Lycorma delicatula TaxID=130591 RepID=UPI003F513013
MKIIELEINDLHTVKTEEEMEFYPGHVITDKGTYKGSTKNRITRKRCVNNSVYDKIIKEKSSEYKCAHSDVTIKNLVKDINSENKIPTQNDLKTHLITHNKKKNYVCKLCQKSFNFRCNLTRHLKMHKNKKYYVCNFCHKSLNSEYRLNIHLATHKKDNNLHI